MNVLREAFQWLNDPLTWTGPASLTHRIGEHLTMTALAMLWAMVIALPIGVTLGHRRRGATIVTVAVNASRALPTFGVLLLLASGGMFGERAAIAAAAVFAIPLIVANTHTAVADIDPDARDAAQGMGLSTWRSLWHVELPLAVPLLAAGIRTATVQVVATIPLAAFVGGGGLGAPLRSGFSSHRYGQVLAVGLVIALLCLLIDAVAAVAQRAVTPRPLRSRPHRQAG